MHGAEEKPFQQSKAFVVKGEMQRMTTLGSGSSQWQQKGLDFAKALQTTLHTYVPRHISDTRRSDDPSLLSFIL
jgi:hypothetical protein